MVTCLCYFSPPTQHTTQRVYTLLAQHYHSFYSFMLAYSLDSRPQGKAQIYTQINTVYFIYNDVIEKRNLVQVVLMAATFSSALAYALSCVGKPGLVLKDKQLEALKCLYAGVYVGTVPTSYGKSICFPDSPFLD